MRRVSIAIALTLALMGLVFAQGEKVATATSKSTFQLKGASVNPSGVPSWPVNAGDAIVAGSAPVTLTFADGSTVSLAPGSKGDVEMENGKPVFRLTGGEALYNLKSSDAVKLLALDRTVRVSALQGHYALGGSRVAGGTFWTPGHIALVTGVVVGTGVGVGVAVANSNDSPAPVSGSK